MLGFGFAGSGDGVLEFALIEKDGVDVAFEMVDCDERNILRVSEGLSVGNSDEERTGEAWAGGDGYGIEIREGDLRLMEHCADYGDDGAKMLAAGEFGNNTAITGMSCDLGGDNGREGARPALDNGGSGLVAGGFDGEDEAAFGHVSSLAGLAELAELAVLEIRASAK